LVLESFQRPTIFEPARFCLVTALIWRDTDWSALALLPVPAAELKSLLTASM